MNSDTLTRGHSETIVDLPTPTGGPAWQRWVLPALPAVTLSVASMVALVAVPVLLLADPLQRQLFRLPVGASWVAVPAAGLAWLVVWGCRGRPGRHLPRYWAVGLAGLAGLVAAVALLSLLEVLPWRYLAWIDALAAACMASTLILLPRLAPRRPDQSFFWIAPLALMLAVPGIVAPARWATERAVEGHVEDLRDRAAAMEQTAERLRSVAAHPWETLAKNPGAAEAQVDSLRTVAPADLLATDEEWRVAGLLGLEAELVGSRLELESAMADVLEGPGLGAVSEPPIYFDQGRRAWVANDEFPYLSGLVGEYYGEAGRVFRLLRAAELSAPPGAPLDSELVERAERWRREAAGRWSTGWLVQRFEGVAEGEGVEISRLLRQPLADDGEALVAADLPTLMRWPVGNLDRAAMNAPSCHSRSYEEGRRSYRRLDCYAFEADPQTPGARLRVEMRLVYATETARFVGSDRVPREVYFLFPVPGGSAPDEFKEHAIRELYRATTESWRGPVRTLGRGGSPAEGFVLGAWGDGVTVYRPRVVPYQGGQRAVEIRAVPSFRT